MFQTIGLSRIILSFLGLFQFRIPNSRGFKILTFYFGILFLDFSLEFASFPDCLHYGAS